MNLSDREMATVLAALRYWQDEMGCHGRAAYPEHFEETEPLTAPEIDALCERLNAERGTA